MLYNNEKVCCKIGKFTAIKKMPMTIDRIPSIRQNREQRARVGREM